MIATDDVKTWLRVADDADDALLDDVVAATNAWVAQLPTVTELTDPDVWPDDVTQGAVMLAARLYRRRNSPSGVEPFTDGAVYLPRRDGDVDALLHVGFYAAPRVG